MRVIDVEKQKLTDMLGRLAEDRFFVRRAADERRLHSSAAGDRQARADRSKRSLAADVMRALGLGALIGFGALLIAVFVMRA